MAPRKTRHVTSRVGGAEEEKCDVGGESDDDAIVVVLAKDDEITHNKLPFPNEIV